MKIAIIGSGISGLVAAYHLNKVHDIQVFEAESWIGGHTHTVSYDGLNIDTGFIVFNDRTYPHFRQLLDALGVSYRPSEMSFSVRNDDWQLEYNGNNLNSLFADRKNLLRPNFYRLINDILKFNKLVKNSQFSSDDTLSKFIAQHNFSHWFTHGYILPMAAAIWSMGIDEVVDFPLQFFAKFFVNHGLLDIVNRPQWFTIVGGSKSYVEKLTQSFLPKIQVNSRVNKVTRNAQGVVVSLDGQQLKFDKVVFACHADQALALLQQPTADELRVLSPIKYTENHVVLHTDTTVLPKRKLAHASWNYLMTANSAKQATLTYNMNILQGLTAPKTYCVTLNATDLIAHDKILAEFRYTHPVYSIDMVKAQSQAEVISGKNNSHFCGAYWRNGFHEDGVLSGLRVCKELEVATVY